MNISNNLKKTLFFTITLIIGGFIFITVIDSVGIENIIKSIINFQLKHFILLLVLSLISAIVSTLRWKIVLDATGNITSFHNVFAARMIGSSINYLTPSGLVFGEPFKAVILTGKTDLKLGSTMSSIIIEGSIFLSTTLLFIIIGILAFFSYSSVSLKISAIVLGALIFFLSIFYLFYTKLVKSTGKTSDKGLFTYIIDTLHLHKLQFINKLRHRIAIRELEIKNFFQHHKKIVFIAIFLSILEISINLTISWLTIYFLGLSAGIKALLGLFSLMNIAYIIPLPGSLGGLEISQIFAFSFFSLGGQTTALAYTLITRLVSLVLVSVGIGYLVHFELRIISEKIIEYSIKFKQKIRGFLQSL